jgi:4-hydroxybenzoate polyprenyltransferase
VRFKSVLALCRVSNLPTIWMNVISASIITSSIQDQPVQWSMVVIIALAISAFYCGGMSLNDVCDFTWDKEHQPYRPIVQAKVSLTQAKTITWILFAIGFGLLALAPSFNGLIYSVVLFAIIYGYNIFHKQYAGSVFLMAGARAMVFVVTAQALVGELNQWIVLAAALQFIYTLVLTLVGRMIAGMAILDGIVLAILVAPIWLVLGILLAFATRFGQRYVRGD